MGAYRLPLFGTEKSGGRGMLENLIRTTGKKVKIKLHTGDPGESGVSNPATETTEKEVEITEILSITSANWVNGRKNTAAVEWPEVKANETYKWITIRDPAEPAQPILCIELTAPVAVVIGDTFRINKEKLLIKLKLA